jgi:acetyl esterase/lipase
LGVLPLGPGVGEIVDGVLPGAVVDLAYRLSRPPSPGPHPIVVYFHGGGYVLGGAISDDRAPIRARMADALRWMFVTTRIPSPPPEQVQAPAA